MARFEFFADNSGGFLLDVQTDLLSGFNTRLVVPLMPAGRVPAPTRRLHPAFAIEGKRYIMATHLMAAVPASELRLRRGSLDHEYDTITDAIGMIFLGF
jgi:toxin CcdB